MIGFDPRPVARRFWGRAGALEPFPRRLTPTIAAVLPVAVVLLPKLSVSLVSEWLHRRRVGQRLTGSDRVLRGCLVAHRGHGLLFVDGSLPVDEQRFTLAHELAHFLHHYERVRDAALSMLGTGIAAVLDGERAPTNSERLSGVMRGIPIGVYEHALDRASGGQARQQVWSMEAEADLIALELLAPAATVARTAQPGSRVDRLKVAFGLPGWAAAGWARWIDARYAQDPLIARLKEASRKKSSG